MVMKEVRETLSFGFTRQFWRMGVLWTFYLIISYIYLLFNTFFFKPNTYTRLSLPLGSNQPHKPLCIITGATSGLGAAAAYSLSMEGFFVILVGRSTYRLSKVEEDIIRRNKDAQLKCFTVDVSSFESLVKFKHLFKQWLSDSGLHFSVQLLVNNAGILAMSSRYTTEGYDHYIVNVLLTSTSKLEPNKAVNSADLSGVYFFGGNGRTVNSSAISYNAKLARELWDASCDLFSESCKACDDN